MVETERTPHHSYTSEDEDFNLVFIQSYMFKKIKKPKTSLFPFGNEHLFCKPLLGNFLPHRFLFSPLFCGQQPIEIDFHLFPWNLLCALRAAEGQKGEQRGYSSHGGCRAVCAQDTWGLQCWHLVCTCMEVSDPARVLFIHTWDRACEPHDLFCRNMMVKIGHLKWCWFFLSSNDATSSKILLQKIYSQEGIFRSTDLTLLFKLWLLFIVWLVAKS